MRSFEVGASDTAGAADVTAGAAAETAGVADRLTGLLGPPPIPLERPASRREVIIPSARFRFRWSFRYSVCYYGATVASISTTPNIEVAVVVKLLRRAVDR